MRTEGGSTSAKSEMGWRPRAQWRCFVPCSLGRRRRGGWGATGGWRATGRWRATDGCALEHGLAVRAGTAGRPLCVEFGVDQRDGKRVDRCDGRRSRRAPPTFDCFYVYPTVSAQRKDNANLKIQPAEIAVAIAQASRFSQVCRVWAPMYRQRTGASLQQGLGNDPAADQVAYDSLLSDWEDYLAHDNDGRPVIFIGHSQGAAMLIRLLRSQIDPHPALRKQMVSALILGGNVQVPKGKTVGGSFKHIPTCDSPQATTLRHRLLDLWRRPSALVRLRPARTRGQPPVGSDRLERGTGGLREPGDVLGRQGCPGPLFSERRHERARRDGDDTLGLVSGFVHGAVSEQGRRHVAPGRFHCERPGDRRPRVTASLGPGLGVSRRGCQSGVGRPRPGRGAGGSRLQRLSASSG